MFSLTSENVEYAIGNAFNVLKETYPPFIQPKINYYKLTNATSYWANIGKCKEDPNGYGLHISKLFELIQDQKIAELKFYSCIIHEIIHTIPGCENNHGDKFNNICELINSKYPEYKIQTSISNKYFKTDLPLNSNNIQPKYILKCKSCGKEYFYFRKPRYDIKMYRCTVYNCGGKLKLIDNNKKNKKSKKKCNLKSI